MGIVVNEGSATLSSANIESASHPGEVAHGLGSNAGLDTKLHSHGQGRQTIAHVVFATQGKRHSNTALCHVGHKVAHLAGESHIRGPHIRCVGIRCCITDAIGDSAMAASQLQSCGIVGAHHFDAFNFTEVRVE